LSEKKKGNRKGSALVVCHAGNPVRKLTDVDAQGYCDVEMIGITRSGKGSSKDKMWVAGPCSRIRGSLFLDTKEANKQEQNDSPVLI